MPTRPIAKTTGKPDKRYGRRGKKRINKDGWKLNTVRDKNGKVTKRWMKKAHRMVPTK